ncbi:MAG TPA: glycosyl transferase [Marinilabiliales bacterium]|jgi:glucosyl-3-phosphoglycerate synthase|nr:hypothetical protein [Salinivirgaceae bacterium]OFX40729.1 MAG: glycosyl transferase [Bacteroidetes bacterium GWA2_40_14]OFX65729.1 MAG: glycosyl transferase [Bacteroidetes bacterium GWC2_40_13]OFX75984.1 MAG: glycosyl transferase [Bacteroidetes bacterium GWD2_40_43]OFX94402.1 MAG: glycosyl transferase [Bacteroidetes bacterium GWE2_40_63]OFY18880.1 MAG: glycosyl transferase [Bacteroidetes bacterium GWF2_40_13]OFZ28895.1 MAG: glycosyl transferase [Bacteroidetes bacterium RIFOXYC2_FULL_40_12
MGDFFQNSEVTTLHNFRNRSLEDLEKEILECSTKKPIGLFIPSLYTELERPALKQMVSILKEIPYLGEIVIGLDGASEKDFQFAKDFFAGLPQHHRIIWNDGPRMKHFEFRLTEENIHLGNPGKGKNMWYGLGYMIASGKSEAIALHYADILTYNREILARLIYPVCKPVFNYKFCKGFYFRSDEHKMNGRMVRLLVSPLVRSLKTFFGPIDYLVYLNSFRYILAGEIAIQIDLAKNIRIPTDFGLELGLLTELDKHLSPNQICQVEIADQYDHRHQSESFENPDKGLSRMSFDIARTIYAKMASSGSTFSEGMFRSIKATYHRIALEMVEQYQNDALMNGLTFDRHREERLVDQLSKNVYQAGVSYLNNPSQNQMMPTWNWVMAAVPEALHEFYQLVEEDNA